MSARHLVVHGTVQGVFYRASAEQEAGRLGVAGWVRNRADGTVEMLLEGPTDAMDAMVRWAHEGPARADVTRVDVTEHEPEGLTAFTQR